MSRFYTIIGDPHVTHKSMDKASQLFSIVESMGNDTVWLGDLLDTKEVIRGKCLNLFFNYFKESKINHIIIIGNHDWFNLECQDHSLQTLKSLSNVTIVDKPTIMNKHVFIPYVHGSEETKKILKDLPKCEVLFAHLEVSEFDYGNGHVCDTGILLKDLKKFNKVISGHFHKYQSKDNLIYLGTPFSHSFGESNQDKFIGILNTSNNDLQLINTPFPKHVTTEIDVLNMPTFINLDPSNYNRVVLKGPKNVIDGLSSEYLNQFKDFKVLKKYDTSSDDLVTIEETLSNELQFVQWAEQIAKMDEETIRLGLSIMGSVNGK